MRERSEAEATALRGQIEAAERRAAQAEARAREADQARRIEIEAINRRGAKAEAELARLLDAERARRSRRLLARVRAALKGE